MNDYQSELTEKRRAAIWRSLERMRQAEQARQYKTPLRTPGEQIDDAWCVVIGFVAAMILTLIASALCYWGGVR